MNYFAITQIVLCAKLMIKPIQTPRINAHFSISQALCQSLFILQLPQPDLATKILEEIEKNPLLEIEDESTFHSRCISNIDEIPSIPSFFDKITKQIRESFPSDKDKKMAKELLFHLDTQGFFTGDVEKP